MSHTVLLADLLAELQPLECAPSVEGAAQVTQIASDSRVARDGTLYVALSGAKTDGHQFVRDVITKGAIGAVVQAGPAADELLAAGLPVIVVPDSRIALARAANRFWGHPSSDLKMFGVTGTNGKTSVTWIIANLLSALGVPSGIVGTLGTTQAQSGVANRGEGREGQNPQFTETANTSPDPLVVQPFLAHAVAAGSLAAAVEVTSQGVAQARTTGVHWNCAAFTNLTRDHLDLHGTFDAYGALKARLFNEQLAESSKPDKTAIINLDDEFGERLYHRLSTDFPQFKTLGYSANGIHCDYFVVRSHCSLDGTVLHADFGGREIELRSRLLGRYNVANILTAVAAIHSQGYDLDRIAAVLPDILPVPGRLEPVGDGSPDGGPIKVFVDYAHTPDALVNVQHSLRELTPGRLITVFGCGGDRDRGKRPLMAKVVSEWADVAVVTSDNPRTEDPAAIIADILPGLADVQKPNFIWKSEVSRDKAINQAIALAQPGDVVLVAGKGHEDYQEICGVKHRFLDTEVCRDALLRREPLS